MAARRATGRTTPAVHDKFCTYYLESDTHCQTRGSASDILLLSFHCRGSQTSSSWPRWQTTTVSMPPRHQKASSKVRSLLLLRSTPRCILRAGPLRLDWLSQSVPCWLNNKSVLRFVLQQDMVFWMKTLPSTVRSERALLAEASTMLAQNTSQSQRRERRVSKLPRGAPLQSLR
jgi:hypothetical protein